MTIQEGRRAFVARVGRLIGAAGALALLGGRFDVLRASAAPNRPGGGQPPTTNADRAVLAYNAMQQTFAVNAGALQLYRETSPARPTANPYSFLWAFEEATKATLFMAGLSQVGSSYAAAVDARQAAREAYWEPSVSVGLVGRPAYASYVRPPLGQGGDKYFDDNTWVALDLIQHHRMRNRASSLDRARTVLDYLVAGRSGAQYASSGLTFWVDAAWNRDRGSATNLGAAALAAHLHELDAAPNALTYAQDWYTWTRAALLDQGAQSPTRGLYHNALRGDGSLDGAQWIYNQGVAIAAGVVLRRVSGPNTPYLDDAVNTANAALAFYGARDFYSQPAIFNAIFFRNLLQLHAATGIAAYRDTMQQLADRVWNDRNVHDSKTHLFKFSRTARETTLLDQAAMVQMYAALAWPSSSSQLLA